MPRHLEQPNDRPAYLRAALDRAAALGAAGDDLAALRAALDGIDALDPDTADLWSNLRPIRERLARALTAGELTIDQARGELADARQRVDTDEALRDVLADARRRRLNDAWTTATRIDWRGLLVPIGHDAAQQVIQLGEKLPAGFDDHQALRAAKKSQDAWLDFGRAVRRWQATVDLLLDLVFSTVLSPAPLAPHELDMIKRAEWYFSGPHGAFARVAVDHNLSDPTGVLADVHAGAVPGVPSPVDLEERMNARRDVREANLGLRQLGFEGLIPGADVPVTARLPEHVAHMLIGANSART